MNSPAPEKTREDVLSDLLRQALAERYCRGNPDWITKAERELGLIGPRAAQGGK